MRFRAGGESKVNYLPLPSHHVICVAFLTLRCSCNSSVEWFCTEVPLCAFLPFIIHASSLSEFLFAMHSGDK